MKKLLNKSNAKILNNRGFSIIEIMITLALLALLFNVVNASVMKMEREVAAGDLATDAETLYTIVSDILVSHTTLDELIDNRPSGSDGEWRGFNPGLNYAGVAIGGYDVAYMVDYQNCTAEAPTVAINYESTGVDVKEGYQIPELVGLVGDEEGYLWAYGILLELGTYIPLEVTLVKIPYDNTGSASQTATNAQAAAKIASSVIGTGVRDGYSNYLGYTYTNPATGNTVVPTTNPTVSAVTGYPNGITHVFNRDNMLCTISADMLYSRYRYCVWTVDNVAYNGAIHTADTYLDLFNRTLDGSLSYYGANS